MRLGRRSEIIGRHGWLAMFSRRSAQQESQWPVQGCPWRTMRDAGFFNKQRRFSYVNDHSSIPGRSSSSGTCSTHRIPHQRGMLDTQRRFSYVHWTFRGVATWRSRFRRRGLFHVKIRLERTGLFIIMYYASNQPLNSELVRTARLSYLIQ